MQEEDRIRIATADGRLSASFIPRLNMVGWSLRHDGEELLLQANDPDAYRTEGAVYGIPLLHPWANRLGATTYEAAGRRVALDPASPHVELEEHDLPIHGLMNACPHWRVVERAPDGLCAELDFGARPELLAAFPFPHRVRLAARVAPGALTIAVTVLPAPGTAVPIAFGFHPYLRLPGAPRADWRIELAARRAAVLDERLVPTGVWRAVDPAAPQPLGARAFDDLYGDFASLRAFAMSAAGRTIAVRLLRGYRFGQLWADPQEDAVSFEPMTAPGDALRSGRGLRLARGPHTAVFRIEVARNTAGALPPAGGSPRR
ncbi:MAG: aldose 1-epimerase [Actinobacteria bacterium]|nr:aldose 1-epimerase [Actinomycetota bacterium]